MVLEDRCLKPRYQQGHFPSEVSRKNPSLTFSASYDPRGPVGCRSRAPVSASIGIQPSPLCVFSYKDSCHWIRVHPNPVWPHRNLLTSAKTLCSERSHSEVPSGHEVLGDTIKPTTLWYQALFDFHWLSFTSVLPVIVDRLIPKIKTALTLCWTYSNLFTYINSFNYHYESVLFLIYLL